MPPDIIKLLMDGMNELKTMVRDMNQKIEDVAIQRNEQIHIKEKLVELEKSVDDLDDRQAKIETACITNHVMADRREKTFGRRLLEGCIMAVVISAVMTLCGILGFTMFTNTQAFYDFHHTQTTAPGHRP